MSDTLSVVLPLFVFHVEQILFPSSTVLVLIVNHLFV